VSSGALLRLDAHTLAPTAEPLALTREPVDGLAVGGGYLWVTVPDKGEALRIDTSRHSIARIRLGGAPAGIAFAGGTVWVADPRHGQVDRLNPGSLALRKPLRLGGAPASVAAGSGYVFVGDVAHGTITRIDARSGRTVGLSIRVAPPAKGTPELQITPSNGSVWVSSFASKTLTRVSAAPATTSLAPPATAVEPQATNVLPLPAAGTVVATLRVPPEGGPLTVGEGAVWAMSNITSTLLRIDPSRNAVVARIKLAEGVDAAVGDGAVWIAHQQNNTVSRIDPKTNTVSATIDVPGRPSGVAVSPGAVWIANTVGPRVTRIDPVSNRIVATIPLGGTGICCADHMSLAADGGAVWAADAIGKRLVRIDQHTNKVTAVLKVDFVPCGQVEVADQTVWSAGADCTDVVERIDARTKQRTANLTEPHAVGVIRAFGSVWVAALGTGNMERIDPRTARVIARLHVGGFPVRLASGFGSIWLNDDKGRLLRIDPR
jgi:YVTN family beta-propeller protein